MGLPTFGVPRGTVTRGIETSYYPQEKKTIVIPLVKAIEKGTGQTESLQEIVGRCGVWTWALPNFPIRSLLESSAAKGDSPVRERKKVDTKYPEYCWSNIQ